MEKSAEDVPSSGFVLDMPERLQRGIYCARHLPHPFHSASSSVSRTNGSLPTNTSAKRRNPRPSSPRLIGLFSTRYNTAIEHLYHYCSSLHLLAHALQLICGGEMPLDRSRMEQKRKESVGFGLPPGHAARINCSPTFLQPPQTLPWPPLLFPPQCMAFKSWARASRSCFLPLLRPACKA